MESLNETASGIPVKKVKNLNVRVYVRVRPLNVRETSKNISQSVNVVSPHEIVTQNIVDARLSKKFTFDRVFGPKSTQDEVYNTVVAPYIAEVLAGYNCTVFAYGQTGTGKTYSMIGHENSCAFSNDFESDVGIIPRAVNHLFDELRIMDVDFSMRVSYLELYNEELCDLLSTDDCIKIRLFEDMAKKGSVIIQGLEENIVHDRSDVFKLLEKGKERRKTASTLINAQSSRSHTVFSILVHIRETGSDGEEVLKIGKLNLVDLAGSENILKAGNDKGGIRTRETVNINQSLLTLGRVITALADRAAHVPYRESKLTRLLQESLGGRTKTSIIATVSPGKKDMDETLSTLEYAYRAKNIQNKPEINQTLTKHAVIKQFSEEIDRLKRELQATREKNGIFLPPEMYEEMINRNESLSRELRQNAMTIKALKAELNQQKRLCSEAKSDLDKKDTELAAIKRRVKEKKKVIEVQVETEKVLSEQAAEILNVAKDASQDTYKLHETLERRQNVDRELEMACHRFSETTTVDFAGILEKLNNFQANHNDLISEIQSEFHCCEDLQNKIYADSNDKVAEIKETFKNLSEGNKTYISDETKILHNKATGHFSRLIKSAEDLQQKESEGAMALENALNDLSMNTAKLQTEFKALAERMGNLLQKRYEELITFSCIFKIKLKSLIDISERDINELKFLKGDSAAEKDFLKQLSSAIETRCRENANQNESIKRLESHYTQRLLELGSIEQETEHFEKSSRANNKLQQKENRIEIRKFLSSLENNDETYRRLKKDTIEVAQQDKLNDIARLISAGNCFMKSFNKECSEYKSNLENNMESNFVRLSEANDELISKINGEAKELHESMARGRGLLNCAAKQTEGFSNSLKDRLTDSKKMIQQFLQSEVKTYKPTGATPSKRDFTYPLVLASALHPNEIIQHFRRENDWSDVDTTIDEEITEIVDGIELNEINLIKTPSETAMVINSTALNPTLLKAAKSDTAVAKFSKPLSRLSFESQYRSETSLTALHENAKRSSNTSTSTLRRNIDTNKFKKEKGDKKRSESVDAAENKENEERRGGVNVIYII